MARFLQPPFHSFFPIVLSFIVFIIGAMGGGEEEPNLDILTICIGNQVRVNE